MKSILVALLLLPTLLPAQKLIRFTQTLTGETWKETTWVPFMRKGFKTRGYEVDARFRKQDSIYYFEIMIDAQVRTHLVDVGNLLAFMGDNDKPLVVLKCIEGIDTRESRDVASYPITKEQTQVLLDNHVKDIKMQYRKGYTVDGLTDRKLLDLRNGIYLIRKSKRFDGKPPRIVAKNR